MPRPISPAPIPRRVKRALGALLKGAVGKGVVSRTWRKVKTDWENWNRRSLAADDIVRLVLDGTVVKVRLDRKATSVSLLVVLGVRGDGQKLLLAVRNMGGESEAACRSVLDDLITRGLQTSEFLLIDGGADLERALVGPVIRLLAADPQQQFADQATWQCHLERLGITALHVTPDPVSIATEGALWGAVTAHGFLQQTVVLSDDASQFAIAQHALCWTHAERLAHKLNAFSEHDRAAQQRVRGLIRRF